MPLPGRRGRGRRIYVVRTWAWSHMRPWPGAGFVGVIWTHHAASQGQQADRQKQANHFFEHNDPSQRIDILIIIGGYGGHGKNRNNIAACTQIAINANLINADHIHG